jgi:hypothetical protein
VDSGVWVGAVTTLVGVGLGGAVSFVLSRQQLKDARLQRKEQEEREERQRSFDRRFHVYSEFLTRARSYRNAVQAYYLRPDNKPSVQDIDTLDHAANDASSDVFLLVESEDTFEGCVAVLRAMWRTQTIIHQSEPSAADNPWPEINTALGRSTREFQNFARKELEVIGPAKPWVTYDDEPPPKLPPTESMAQDPDGAGDLEWPPDRLLAPGHPSSSPEPLYGASQGPKYRLPTWQYRSHEGLARARHEAIGSSTSWGAGWMQPRVRRWLPRHR